VSCNSAHAGELGVNRRGGEKPRGRNATGAMARAGRRDGDLGRYLGSGRAGWSPDGGALEEARDGVADEFDRDITLAVMRRAGKGAERRCRAVSQEARWSREAGNSCSGRVRRKQPTGGTVEQSL
jgi:hypothetical protein